MSTSALSQLRRALTVTHAQIARLKRRGKRDFGTHNEWKWSAGRRMELAFLKDRARNIQEKIDAEPSAYPMEAAE
jgi:hypothetical protein